MNRFSPVASKILELAPIEDPLFPDMLRNIPALGSGSPEFQETMLTVKGDHVINANHRLSALFNRNFRSRYNSGSPRWGIASGIADRRIPESEHARNDGPPGLGLHGASEPAGPRGARLQPVRQHERKRRTSIRTGRRRSGCRTFRARTSRCSISPDSRTRAAASAPADASVRATAADRTTAPPSARSI